MKVLNTLKAMMAPVADEDVARKKELDAIILQLLGIDLTNIPTLLMGDSSTFTIARINIITAGTGYTVGDSILLSPVPAVVIFSVTVNAVGSNGEVLGLDYPYIAESTDFTTDGTAIAGTGGTGTGLEVDIVTMYAVGSQVIQGLLSLVPDKDPVVQYSLLIGYVRDIFAQYFPVTTGNIADYAITANKIDDGAIYAGSGIVITKANNGIEIAATPVGGSTIDIVFTNYDQNGVLIN